MQPSPIEIEANDPEARGPCDLPGKQPEEAKAIDHDGLAELAAGLAHGGHSDRPKRHEGGVPQGDLIWNPDCQVARDRDSLGVMSTLTAGARHGVARRQVEHVGAYCQHAPGETVANREVTRQDRPRQGSPSNASVSDLGPVRRVARILARGECGVAGAFDEVPFRSGADGREMGLDEDVTGAQLGLRHVAYHRPPARREDALHDRRARFRRMPARPAEAIPTCGWPRAPDAARAAARGITSTRIRP